MSIVFDRAVKFYDQTRGLPPDVEPQIAQVIREHTQLQPGSAVLEIGIGTGRIALPLARENGYQYTGVDLSREMMRELRAKAPDPSIRLVRGDVAALPFPDATFDAVVAVHIFHLIDRWSQAIDEAQRVLKAGGVLLHGRNHRSRTSPAWMLRQTLSEFADVRAERQRAGLLDQIDIRPQLEARFGAPREAATSIWYVRRTPQHVLDQFRDRIYSGTWETPDDVLARALERGQDWAFEHFGSLDAPLADEQQFVWEIYAKRATSQA